MPNREQQLQILIRATRQINTVLEMPVVLRRLIAAALDLTGAESGTAGLMVDGRMVFTEYNRQGELIPIDYSFDSGYGVPGWVMQTREPYLSDDAEHDPHVVPEIQRTLRFHNLVDVPILDRECRLLGCLELHDKAGGQHFDQHDVELLGTLATSAAIALQNARLLAEKARAEEALQETDEIFAAFLERSPIYVFFKDENLRALYLSRNYEQMIGRPIAELLGKSMFDLFPGELAAAMVEDDRRILAEGKVVELTEELDGRTYTTTKFPIIRPGKPPLLAGFTIDITEHRRAEQERWKLQAQLIQAQKMESVGQLAGGVAHDFNNMLSVIIGTTELALDKVRPGDPLHADLKEIRKAAGRSADITRQLLAFARQQSIEPRVLDLNETVGGMMKMLRRVIGEDIELAWTPGAAALPVLMDPSQIDQILANLCVNARDAIQGVGRITVEADKVDIDEAYCVRHAGLTPGSFVCLSVSDNGCGMDPDTLASIFEPFFTTKGLGYGTGLGLSTVYGIVKQNRGFLNVYSEPGVGTTFRIYLPRHAETPPAAAEEAQAPVAARGGETVLVVEDDPAILELVGRILGKLGYAVLSAPGPREALDLGRRHEGTIDLLLTDIIMPEMNGRELTERLRAERPGLEVLYMSGYTANVIAHSGVIEDGVNFIAKPFTIGDLALRVRKVLVRKD